MPKDKSLKRKRNRGQSIISVILGFEESLRKVSSSGERIIHGILNALWKICSLVVMTGVTGLIPSFCNLK